MRTIAIFCQRKNLNSGTTAWFHVSLFDNVHQTLKMVWLVDKLFISDTEKSRCFKSFFCHRSQNFENTLADVYPVKVFAMFGKLQFIWVNHPIHFN